MSAHNLAAGAATVTKQHNVIWSTLKGRALRWQAFDLMRARGDKLVIVLGRDHGRQGVSLSLNKYMAGTNRIIRVNYMLSRLCELELIGFKP